MLLSGIMITIAFIMTAMTVSQVASLEREAATQKPSSLATEWRFIHARLASNFNTAITLETKNETFKEVTFPAIAETFRAVEAEKGYDIVIRLAGSSLAVNKTEADLVSGLAYKADLTSVDGLYSDFAGAPMDPDADGILHYGPCPDAAGPASGCIGALLVAVHLSDGLDTINEVMLFGVNRN